MRSLQSIVFLCVLLTLTLAPGVALIARAVPSARLAFLTEGFLYGVVPKARTPTIDRNCVLGGSAQADLEPWLAERMGRPRELLIRTNNMFDFLIDRSFNPNILFGKGKHLYTRESLNDWCLPVNLGFVDDLANGLAETHKRLRAMGKAMVFLLSPSKAALYPDHLPGYCRKSGTERPHDRLIAMLQAHGVAYVDAQARILQARSEWPSFGQYGQHWNDIGQYHALRAVLAEFESQLGRTIGNLAMTGMRVDSNPAGDEADTGILLNLPFALHPVSPHPAITGVKTGAPIRIIAVGTSFSGGPVRMLINSGLVDQITVYNYFHWVFRYEAGGVQGKEEPRFADIDLTARIGEVDAILLESNDAALGSRHVANFAKALRALQ